MSLEIERAPISPAASPLPRLDATPSAAPRPSWLGYRGWDGRFRPTILAIWPIARTSLGMLFRRKAFWVIYALGLLTFLMFFFGQYLLAWSLAQAGDLNLPFPGFNLQRGLLEKLQLNGSEKTYRNFFFYQGWMLMVLLAFAGALLIGNDFRFGSLPYYLSKPLGAWHYLAGKCLAVAVIVNLMTTVPALVLFFQYRFLYEFGPLEAELRLLGGIIAYGMILTVVFSLMLLATSSWLRKTVPLIMAWTTLFAFTRLLATALVDGLGYEPRWRLIDLWNNTYLLGNQCLGIIPSGSRPQPAWQEAGLVLLLACLGCLLYLHRRVRAVEVVR
jgi:ABC-type transport system involved in multi-copper enzyme maturation permease subunit